MDDETEWRIQWMDETIRRLKAELAAALTVISDLESDAIGGIGTPGRSSVERSFEFRDRVAHMVKPDWSTRDELREADEADE